MDPWPLELHGVSFPTSPLQISKHPVHPVYGEPWSAYSSAFEFLDYNDFYECEFTVDPSEPDAEGYCWDFKHDYMGGRFERTMLMSVVAKGLEKLVVRLEIAAYL